MLPGMSASCGSFARTEYYPVATASATGAGLSPDITVNKPTGTVDGDIMVAAMFTADYSGDTWTGDTGWTEIIDQGAFPDFRVAYKVAASEGSSYTFSAINNVAGLAAIVTFRGLQYDTAGGSLTTQVGNGSMAITGITLTGGLLLAIVASAGPSGSPTHTVPTGMALAYSGTNGSIDRLSIYYQTMDSGATGTRTTTIGSNTGEDSVGILVGLKP